MRSTNLIKKTSLVVVVDAEVGGTQLSARIFARAFDSLGYRSFVFLCTTEEICEKDLSVFGKGLSWFLDQHGSLLEFVQVHSHGVPDQVYELVLRERARFGYKVLETNVFNQPTRYSRDVDLVQVFSSFGLSRYMRTCKKANVFVAPNPMLSDGLSYKTRTEKSVVIGRIGQPDKGSWSERYVDLVKYVYFNSTADMLFVGMPAEYLNLIPSNILWSGRLEAYDKTTDSSQLQSYYRRITRFVHLAPFGESFGYVNFEALQNGCNVYSLQTPWANNAQGEYMAQQPGAKTYNSITRLLYDVTNDPLHMQSTGTLDAFASEPILEELLSRSNCSQPPSPPTKKALIDILNNSIDRPSIFTKTLIYLGIFKLIRYVVGETSRIGLLRIIIRKAKNLQC